MLTFLKSIFSFLGGIATWLNNKQLIDAGKATNEAAVLRETTKDITDAIKARDDMHAIVISSDSVPDDGFRRD
jgi:hypothetical protein